MELENLKKEIRKKIINIRSNAKYWIKKAGELRLYDIEEEMIKERDQKIAKLKKRLKNIIVVIS
jgi:hypothetical protein